MFPLVSIVCDAGTVELPLPPKYVANSTREPVGFNLRTKTFCGPLGVVWRAPGVTGRSEDEIVPVTHASPCPSTEMPDALLFEVPR